MKIFLTGSKVKKVKSKALAGMPSLDVASMAYPKPDRVRILTSLFV